MKVKFDAPTTAQCGNKAAVINTTEDGSTLSNKYLALAYHYCRDNFSSKSVDVRWVDGKHNLDDDMTKVLGTREFHICMSSVISNH